MNFGTIFLRLCAFFLLSTTLVGISLVFPALATPASSAALPLSTNNALELPDLTVNNVSQAEGNSATTIFTFIVSLSIPAPTGGVSFDIATADNSATSLDNDYASQSLTGQSIPAGSFSYRLDVSVNGDTNFEIDETFLVNVTHVVGATVSDGQGTGTIMNDDPPSLADLSILVADSPDPVVVNDHLNYAITVGNAGPSSGSQVIVTDVLPPNTAFVSLSYPAGWSCLTPSVGLPGTILCSTSLLNEGSAPEFTLVVQVTPGVVGGTEILNTASVTFAGIDPDPTNNSATAITSVGWAATTTSLSSEYFHSGFWETWTLTSKVVSSAGTPTGTVTFMDGATTLGASGLSGGTATFIVEALSAGTHSITAVYEGDSVYTGSTSQALALLAHFHLAAPVIFK